MTISKLDLPRLELCLECHSKIDKFISHPTPSHQEATEELLERSRLNKIPDSLERSQIHSLVDNANDELQHCNDSIAQAEAMLAKLKEQRLQMTRRIDLYSSQLSPIRKLPVEILGRIFEFYIRGGLPIQLVAASSSTKSPAFKFTIRGQVFTLTWICSVWRHIAVSHGILWSEIALVGEELLFGGNCGDKIKFPASWITDCLSRSQNRPLHLIVFNYGYGHSSPFDQVLDAAVACNRRWKELHLSCNKESLHYLRLKLESQSNGGGSLAGLLEDLSVSAWTGPEEEVMNLSQNILARSPCLRSLNIGYLCSPNRMDSSNLVTLDIQHYVGPSLVALLAQCPSLQDLTLHEICSQDKPESSPNRGPFLFHHTRLSVLHLVYNSDKDVFNFGTWSLIHLPRLNRLSIERMDTHTNSEMLQEFDLMLIRSQCVLEEVTVKAVHRQEQLSNSITDISSGRLVLDEACSDEYTSVYRRAALTYGPV